jgi:anti-anti-sigma factor
LSLDITLKQVSTQRWECVLTGSLDSDTSPELEAALQQVLLPQTREVTFNMSRVDFISSAGIRVVAIVTKAMKANGGSVAVTELQPQIQRVFDIVKALPALSVFASVAEADEYFAEMQRQVLDNPDP